MEKETSAKTVTVACKHPAGLLLRLFDLEDGTEPVLGGGSRAIKVPVQKGETVRINGPAVPFGKQPGYYVFGGYALTPNIDADFMTRWMKDNADHPLVKNNLIFVRGSENVAKDQAKEQAGVLSGLEPLAVSMDPNAPSKDPRIPRAIRPEKKAAA